MGVAGRGLATYFYTCCDRLMIGAARTNNRDAWPLIDVKNLCPCMRFSFDAAKFSFEELDATVGVTVLSCMHACVAVEKTERVAVTLPVPWHSSFCCQPASERASDYLPAVTQPRPPWRS
jgi:hypothetical protein